MIVAQSIRRKAGSGTRVEQKAPEFSLTQVPLLPQTSGGQGIAQPSNIGTVNSGGVKAAMANTNSFAYPKHSFVKSGNVSKRNLNVAGPPSKQLNEAGGIILNN